MIIVDTPNYYIVSSNDGLPDMACIGQCKRVWWFRDLPLNYTIHQCHWCGDEVEIAEETVHYRVIERRKGAFTPDDVQQMPGKLEMNANLSDHTPDSNVTVTIRKH